MFPYFLFVTRAWDERGVELEYGMGKAGGPEEKKKKKIKKYVGWMNGLGKGGGQRGARRGSLCANRALGSDDEKWT
jgi:hypothetical protein